MAFQEGRTVIDETPCAKCVLLQQFGTTNAAYIASYHARGHPSVPALISSPVNPDSPSGFLADVDYRWRYEFYGPNDPKPLIQVRDP